MAGYWADVSRLRAMTPKAPGIYHGTWEARQASGWIWVENLDASKYGIASQRIQNAIEDLGEKNVAVGHPWDKEEHEPGTFSNQMVGLYIHEDAESIKSLVFTLYRDCDRWLDIDPDEVFG